jgi:HD-GYP domain-containing protein (c-di-GMP phosphodiesterase class II)
MRKDSEVYLLEAKDSNAVEHRMGCPDWDKMPVWAQAFIDSLLTSVKIRDRYTYGHLCRVGIRSGELARELNLDRSLQLACQYAGLLHDVGKIGIPDEVLLYPGRLSDHGHQVMKGHVGLGMKLISPLKQALFFKDVLPGVKHHHERVDGKGYPVGLTGEQIPLVARVVAVADAVDAMTTARVYRSAKRMEFAVDEVKRCSGTQFDPEVARAFLSLIHKQKPEKGYQEDQDLEVASPFESLEKAA